MTKPRAKILLLLPTKLESAISELLAQSMVSEAHNLTNNVGLTVSSFLRAIVEISYGALQVMCLH